MRVVIIGAGVTGLAVAWKLSQDHEVVLLERRPTIGGIASSFKHGSFTLDYGPHKIYSLIPGILDEMKALLGPEAIAIPKTSSAILFGRRLDYPIKFAQLFLKLPLIVSLKLGLGYALAFAKSFLPHKKPVSYADYFRQNFGGPAYELVFKPLAEKSFGNPEMLSSELARRRIPYNGILKLIKSMMFKDKRLSAENFYYPKQGFIEMSSILLGKVTKNSGAAIFNAEVVSLITENNRVSAVAFKHDGRLKKISADFVISTAPITVLPKFFNASPEVTQAAAQLKFRSLLLVYIMVSKPQAMKDNWVFVPDPSFVFQRVSEQKNFSRQLGPESETVLIAEIMCNADDSMWNSADSELYSRVLKDLVRAGFIRDGEGSGFYILKLKGIYPVYDLAYRENLGTVLKYTDQFENFITLGRLGLFNYNNTDHCIDMAIWAANHVRSKKPISSWVQARKRFDEYVIVD